MTKDSLFLLFALGGCHTIADYIVMTPTILSAKSKGTPVFPIINHAAIHALLMGFVMFFMVSNTKLVPFLMIYELITHSIIDILKGRCNVWFPSVVSHMNKIHWILFGLDQYLHFFVIVTIVYFSKM